jgi:hypothetical protein
VDRWLQAAAGTVEGSMRRSLSRLLPLLSLVVFGCSPAANNTVAMDMTAPPVDMGPPAPDLSFPSRAPTDHPPLLQMANGGGPVMKSMEVYTVVWQGDEALGEQVQTFLEWMMTSTYYTGSLAEYGVGPGQAMGVIVLPVAKPATLDDSAISPLIKGYIADHTFPAPNANTVFSFIVPETTQSTLYGSNGCSDYGGYHAETRVATGSNQFVPYAINLQCKGFGGNTPFDGITEVLSHEIAETATDGHPYTDTAYSADPSMAPLGGEVGDLCVGLSTTFNVTQDVADGGATPESYYVTRLYSNKAAAAGNSDPCVPAPAGDPYFDVAVDPIDITLPAGQSMTAKLEPYAFGDVGVIKWALEGQPGQGITVSPESGQVKAGDTVGLTINVAAKTQSGTYPIFLYVDSQKGGSNQWMSAINVQ